ncbi:MAG: hypothetical protein UX02_C0001G0202 [Candidatus Moranbacteria bacterium GW2011_GWC1_45_18]|nr:MAG: hypothetical protein UT79_C0002G0195 [Candidatus Moranbacteria bacterium GW2011_GWC2_40_12]KKT70446.1 MAG: hypothetical protein UW66_C0041G0009 [Candidatus Moranbacteria bacterium GW2011_GWF1_44_4]KKU00754.1 MAG: hypothetical protein UX02_C0001G0202 [Candidatus Moranbacteria bacterium GW2011_GWC1_45_18]OGI35919.1 MAG: hypothetical protein A2407_03350 [Candidatus Moranbacteria bacterium RIFOXYC1_FULL_44_8]OGI39930.1 MAG: hypothetical protein A2374_02570 [Candidatus Moranbacteria bacteriu
MPKKALVTLLIISTLFLFAPKRASAEAWGTNLAAAIEGVNLTNMLDTIEKTMVANLKIMAIRVIQGRLQVLLTGSCGAYCIGGSSGFITDWQDYIFGSAQRTADNTVNTFFNGMRSGISSGMERVVNNAEKAMGADAITQKSDLQNYVSEGKAAFIFDPTKSTSSWQAGRMAFAPQNAEASFFLRAAALDKISRESQEKIRETKAIAFEGFTGTEKKSSSSSYAAGKYGPGGYGTEGEDSASVSEDGLTSLPGSIMKDITSEISLMGVKMTEFARSIPEVVANMVAQTLTNLISNGIRQVTDPIDKSITDVRNKVGTSINQTQSDIQSGMRESIYFNEE